VSLPKSDQAIYRILCWRGEGFVFPAEFLARLEEHLDGSIGSHFDLIAGPSRAASSRLDLGLDCPCDILKLYEDHGPAIFDQQHGRMETWLRQRWRGARICCFIVSPTMDRPIVRIFR
jgi:hypothetical protein